MAEKNPVEMLDKLAVALDKRVGKILWENLTRVRDHLRATMPLHVRSRGLPLVRKPIQLQGNHIQAGLYSPPPWASVHIGAAGTAVTITAKGGGFLAIPTDFVKTFRGAAVSADRYAGNIIFGGIIWGRVGASSAAHTAGGLRQHRAAGEKFGKQDLIPLYILKTSVTVRRRIFPEELIAWVKPLFMVDLKKSMLIDRL